MSEFSEIMRQAKRMCTAHGGMCGARNCPLDNGETCRLLPDYDGEDYNELERIIMDWAKEHPEPVYPNWEDGWRQIFPDAIYTPCLGSFGVKYSVPDCAYRACTDCKSSPMPAEVAEKLGIKPITQNKPVPEHGGCDKCKYEDKSCNDEPCIWCSGNIGGPAPDLWEATDKNAT